jgi:hypothetical protein
VLLQLAAPDNLEQQFQALEGSSVDDDLAKMKAGRLKGGNGSKAQLPEGRPYDQVFKKDAIDEVRLVDACNMLHNPDVCSYHCCSSNRVLPLCISSTVAALGMGRQLHLR